MKEKREKQNEEHGCIILNSLTSLLGLRLSHSSTKRKNKQTDCQFKPRLAKEENYSVRDVVCRILTWNLQKPVSSVLSEAGREVTWRVLGRAHFRTLDNELKTSKVKTLHEMFFFMLISQVFRIKHYTWLLSLNKHGSCLIGELLLIFLFHEVEW